MSRRGSRVLAALNRVMIGAAPRIGSAGPGMLEELNADRHTWWLWRPHPAHRARRREVR